MWVKFTHSCPTLCDPWTPWNSLGQNTGVGSLSLLQGIFPTQGLNPGPLHCRWVLYQLSHKGSLRILEWVAYPFSRGSSWPKNKTGISCIADRFFTNWAMGEAPLTVWFTTKCGKFLKKWEYQTTLLTSWETCMYADQEATVINRTAHGTTDWFKTGKGVWQGCILLPCLFNLRAE